MLERVVECLVIELGSVDGGQGGGVEIDSRLSHQRSVAQCLGEPGGQVRIVLELGDDPVVEQNGDREVWVGGQQPVGVGDREPLGRYHRQDDGEPERVGVFGGVGGKPNQVRAGRGHDPVGAS